MLYVKYLTNGKIIKLLRRCYSTDLLYDVRKMHRVKMYFFKGSGALELLYVMTQIILYAVTQIIIYVVTQINLYVVTQIML